MPDLIVYNSLTRKKEVFIPLHPPFVGMYVCGPTVYGPPHLGHARGAVVFDVIYRFLKYKGYRVRYVRNITDVGHLENDQDEGEDKIAKKARLEQLEPMEVAQLFTIQYQNNISALGVLRPSIEPTASGHIPEQIETIKQIIDKGYAYVSNGSVYFDVLKYAQHYPYGELSGRVLDELLQGTRELDGQSEKRNSADFALWKNASPEHIMKWDSPWGKGFPGWHIECTAMGAKYLGHQFDIHGGGMDLLFPHHESEMAQSKSCFGHSPAKYWLHNNMITINGQKMGKSLGNFITLEQLFSGTHPLLTQAYSPMTIRFFILQAHYRSTLDFSNEALKAASKALKKLQNARLILRSLQQSSQCEIEPKLESEILESIQKSTDGMHDDFNTGIALSHLFNLTRIINAFQHRQLDIHTISNQTLLKLKEFFEIMLVDILGLETELDSNLKKIADSLLSLYKKVKEEKQYDKVDALRAVYKSMGLSVKDGKQDVQWTQIEE